MIVYLPVPYDDELLYSYISRCFYKSGLVSYRNFNLLVYGRNEIRPDIDFINKLSDDFYKKLCDIKNIENIVMDMTMFPYYARFLPQNQKNDAFVALKEMKGNFNDLLSKPRYRNQFLKYCPLCVKEDKENLGETYWHRVHQIPGMIVCPKHACYLLDTEIPVEKNKRITFKHAEYETKNNNIIYGNKLEIEYSIYLSNLLNEINFNKNMLIGNFLSQYINDSIPKFFIKINEFYKETKILDYGLNKDFQIQKILNNIRHNPTEIAQIGFYLKIDFKKSSF